MATTLTNISEQDIRKWYCIITPNHSSPTYSTLGLILFGIATTLLWLRVLLSSWQSWDIPSRMERLSAARYLGRLLLFSAELNDWAWSFYGNEYPFYNLGQRFVNGTMTAPILSGAGVVGKHPALSSVWQGVTMWLFGSDGYGWRVSNSLLLAISIPFLYYFLRPILGRAGGLFAVTLYGSSHVLLSLWASGANNVQIISSPHPLLLLSGQGNTAVGLGLCWLVFALVLGSICLL